jgi:SAM-dependent methyltransferase
MGRSRNAAMDATAGDGDFAKRHLVNPVLLRLLGDVRGQRVLDAGCGNGYLSRMRAARGCARGGSRAHGSHGRLRPGEGSRAEAGVRYVQADLARLPDLDGQFDAVVCSMVLTAIPDWRRAIRAGVGALRPQGLLVFSLVHPAFEGLWGTWRDHGEYRVRRYLEEYEISGPTGVDIHRPISAYLNELASLGCRLREFVEPGLDPTVAADAEPTTPCIEAYVRLANFLIVAAEAP